MKKGNLKKVLAVSLSATLALSASAFAGAPALQADAAAKFVGLNTTFKTLRTGQKDYKLRLVNNTAGWKVKKVTTSDKSICAVYGKKASYVLLKGKSEGRAVVKVSVKTAKREKNNTKTLRCKVNVIAANPSPDTPDVPVAPDLPSTPDASTSAQVSTQAELNNALANQALTTITLKTSASESFTIAAGSYKADLIVDAPNADVTNNGSFRSIAIHAIKGDTWIEKAVGNTIRVLAVNSRVSLETGSKNTQVIYVTPNANAALVVHKGVQTPNVNISAKIKLEISGEVETDTKLKLPVNIQTAAKDSEVIIGIPADVKAGANAYR